MDEKDSGAVSAADRQAIPTAPKVQAKALGGWFIALVVGLAIAGGGLAVWADMTDKSPGYKDAAREIGGAVVSGALLAILVVWFEQRRDNERVAREERRDDVAAVQAWRRDFDLSLFRGILHDLQRARDYARRTCRLSFESAIRNEERTPGSTASMITPPEPRGSPVIAVPGQVDDLTTVCGLLSLPELEAALRDWEINLFKRPTNQAEALAGHEIWAEADEEKWVAVLRELETYRNQNYRLEL